MDAKATRIFLSPPVRQELENISRKSTSEVRLVERAQIVLLAADGRNNNEISNLINCTKQTVRKWRNRFIEDPRISSIVDADRSGRPSVIPVDVRCEVIKIACSHPSDWKLDTRDIWTLGALHEVLNKETGWLISEMEKIGRAHV